MQRQAPNTAVNLRARTLAGLSFAFASLAFVAYHGGAEAQTPAATLPSTGTIAIPTYESVGLYWQSPGGTSGCDVRFRASGETAWKQGLAMWYDARDGQCRGSLVGLTQNTHYQVEMGVSGQYSRGLVFKTWANNRAVAKTITINSGSGTYDIREGGSPSTGYVVYQGASGAVLDGQNSAVHNVTINASYVIVRGLTLKGAKQDAIRISPNVKDVIIEDNDISGWGRTRDGKWGVDMDSAVRAVCSSPTLERVVVQRNRIHDPRYSANSWTDGHPAGPQAIAFAHCGGNHVFRHNEMYSTNGNYFNDIIGGEDNFTKVGFPNSDTDIYGNRMSHAWDDAIEAEGANENVRIFNNYIDRTAIGIATTATSVGPIYIFRNVWNRSQFRDRISSLDADDRQPFFKSGGTLDLGHGRRYIMHNTMLQARQSGLQYGLGGGFGLGGTGSAQLIENTYSYNNIYHQWKEGKGFSYQTGSSSKFTSDMYNGTPGDATVTNGIVGTPVYQSGHGWQSEAGGNYALASNSPGFGRGTKIPNFNDDVAAPDVGAHQSGKPAMRFGISGSPGSSIGAGGSLPPPDTGTPTTPPTDPTTPPTNPTTPPTTPTTPTTGGVTVSPSTLSFSDTQRTQTVTFTNGTSGRITFITANLSSGRYTQSNNCGEVAAGASCMGTVTYHPNVTGTDTGTYTLTSTAPNSPHVVSLKAGAAKGGINVALASTGTVVTASSTGAGFNAASLIDGDRRASNWSNGGGWKDNTSNAYPDWVQLAFAAARTIDRVVVYSIQDSPFSPVEPTDSTKFSYFGAVDFDVEVFAGGQWTRVATVTRNDRVRRVVSFPAVAAERVRVNVAKAAAPYSRLAEIEALTPGEDGNLALASAGATVTASSTGNGFAVESLIDGDRLASKWAEGGGWKDSTANAYPDWIEVDFGSEKKVGSVAVFSLQDNPFAPAEPDDRTIFRSFGAVDFAVQAWNGAGWTTVGTVTANNLVKRTVSFTPVATSRIRVQVTRTPSNYTRLAEIEAYAE